MKGLRNSGLVRTALMRPVTMLMVLASVLVLGTVAALDIPLELIPTGFSNPSLSVVVGFPDATPQDVEEQITIPLETSLSTTPNLKEIVGTSSSSVARIGLVFDGDTDMDLAYREVRDRVQRVRGELPEEVREVRIRKQSSDAIPIAFFGIRWPESLNDVAPDLIERKIVQAMERVDGIGQVNAWGQESREIRIEVNRELAEAANLNIFQIAQRLQTSNFNLASGELHEARGTILVRSLASYRSLDELRDVVVGADNLRLADVAEILYDFPEKEGIERWNGAPTMALFAIKESQANTVEVCDRLKEAVAEAAKDPALAAFEVESIFIQGDTIRASLKQVMTSGLQGGLIAVVVLLFFLRKVRMTMIIALSIPLSMFLSLPFMYFSGQSINIVSLIGLMICIGLVVDNSVVVADNVHRYRRAGVSKFTAALHGASEVALPVTLATATTMVVFLPMALMSSGPIRFFMIRMVTPVCVSLVGSLFVALVLIPLASAYLLEDDEGDEAAARVGRFSGWKVVVERMYEASFGRLQRVYLRLLAASLRRRSDVVMVSVLVLASLYFPLQNVDTITQQGGGGRQVTVRYSIPSHVDVEEADVFFRELEEWFEEHRGEYNATGEFIQINPGSASVQMFFEPPKPGDIPYIEQAKTIYELLPVPPGWEKRSRFSASDGGKSSALSFAIYGDDHETVQTVKERLEREVLRVKGVVSVGEDGAGSTDSNELYLEVDPDLSERYGVSSSVIANTVGYALRGSPLPRYYADERDVDVSIIYRKQDREELKSLLEFKVPNSAGVALPIKSFVDRSVRKGEKTLMRYNKRTAERLSVELDPEDRAASLRRLKDFFDNYRLPEGVSFDADEEVRQVRGQQEEFVLAALLGSLFIFFLMGFLFESLLLPLSVMPSIPLAMVGVWWFLWLTGENLDPLAVVGVLLLLGVVVNNAIVLIDFINIARQRGLSRSAAVVQAGAQRFRPIFMTALTTVGGMLPLAFAQAPAEGIPYNAFGKTLVGGMTTATILTLVIVPVSYTIFDDFRQFALRWTGVILRRPKWGRSAADEPSTEDLSDDSSP